MIFPSQFLHIMVAIKWLLSVLFAKEHGDWGKKQKNKTKKKNKCGTALRWIPRNIRAMSAKIKTISAGRVSSECKKESHQKILTEQVYFERIKEETNSN